MPVPREPFLVRLIRGDARGFAPSLLRLMLAPPSWLFAAATETRTALYRSGVFTCHRVPCPVISVGNITVGGTGKTPLVEWIVSDVRLLGLTPVVLSRGYGAAPDETPDELAALAENDPDLRTVRDADRVRGALTAIERLGAECIVLDDAFQHHRLGRQLDLVTVDATLPFGRGHCLPRGMLREPVRALRRAHGIVVTRSDQVPAPELERILHRLRRVARRATLATARHAPRGLRRLPDGPDHSLSDLDGSRVFAVSAIGNPAAFEKTLRGLGARIVGSVRGRDHAAYSAADLEEISRAARSAGADRIVTTQKDAVKWNGAVEPEPPAYRLRVEIRFQTGRDEIRALLRGALRGASAPG